MKHRHAALAAFLLVATALAPVLAAGRKPAPSQPKAPAECKPGDPSFFRDEALTMKLATKLQFAKPLFREKIKVKVSGGVAMLWGGVSSSEAIATAGKLAAQTEGITCVNNLLKVGPPEPDDSSHTGSGG